MKVSAALAAAQTGAMAVEGAVGIIGRALASDLTGGAISVGGELPVPEVVVDAEAGAPKVATDQEYVYRGVHARHPEIEAARNGTVRPGNVNGTVTPEVHNGGGFAQDSPYTSWTRRLEVAQRNALKEGAGGVVLRLPVGAPPPGATWSWEWSPDSWFEDEVLLKGIRTGAEVLP